MSKYIIVYKYKTGNKAKTSTIYDSFLYSAIESLINRKQIKSITIKKKRK